MPIDYICPLFLPLETGVEEGSRLSPILYTTCFLKDNTDCIHYLLILISPPSTLSATRNLYQDKSLGCQSIHLIHYFSMSCMLLALLPPPCQIDQSREEKGLNGGKWSSTTGRQDTSLRHYTKRPRMETPENISPSHARFQSTCSYSKRHASVHWFRFVCVLFIRFNENFITRLIWVPMLRKWIASFAYLVPPSLLSAQPFKKTTCIVSCRELRPLYFLDHVICQRMRWRLCCLLPTLIRIRGIPGFWRQLWSGKTAQEVREGDLQSLHLPL